ncbi:MAG: hypothetical protein AABX13_04420 [Nanoarchaeota archaeon]
MYQKRTVVDVARDISLHSGSKRAQVTLFIILGLLFLLALVLVIVFRKEVITIKPEELLPTKKGKIETFISNCIADAGREALTKLGLQGGYVVVPAEIANDGSQHLKTSPITVIPYWAYGPTTNIPPLEQIKMQIDDYIEQHVRPCLLNTESFQREFTMVEKSAIEAETQITDAKVIFNVHWDIEIRDQAGEIITELIDHTADSPIKLKRVYETAQRIVEVEMQTMKLEDITQDLIALEHPKVPLAGFEVSCGEKEWPISKVKETIQDLLRVNVRELKVPGTDFVEFPDTLPYYQHHYLLDLGEDFQQPEVAVEFAYENNYPFAFDVLPRSGSLLKSNQLSGGNELLSLLCLQSWKFVYDVTYPVKVTVRDETADYTFTIAFTVHLRRNIPDRSDTALFRKAIFFDEVSDEEFCQNARIPMTVLTYELVEEEKSGVYTRDPLDDVQLSFTCLRYTCPAGKTKYDFAAFGDAAASSANFPYCVGGILRGKKEGYKEVWERLVTQPGKMTELNLIPLHRLSAGQIKVVKHELQEQPFPSVGPAQGLKKSEVAVISLKNYKVNQAEHLPQPFHEVTIVRSAQLDQKTAEGQKVDFLAQADFTYTLEIKVFDDENFVAGYTGNWTVNWEQLKKVNEIVFHTVTTEKASEEDVLELLLGLEEWSAFVPMPEMKS